MVPRIFQFLRSLHSTKMMKQKIKQEIKKKRKRHEKANEAYKSMIRKNGNEIAWKRNLKRTRTPPLHESLASNLRLLLLHLQRTIGTIGIAMNRDEWAQYE